MNSKYAGYMAGTGKERAEDIKKTIKYLKELMRQEA